MNVSQLPVAPAAVSVSLVTLSFLVYHFLGTSASVAHFFVSRFGAVQGQVRHILFNRVMGALLFVASPLVYLAMGTCSAASMGFGIRFNSNALYIVLAFAVLPVVVNYYAARTASNLNMYPQIRIKKWTRPLVAVSAFGWVLYLLGYEALFRGFFFFTCIADVGLPSAICLNVCLYALVHVPKGFNETIGAVPLGIVLCLTTYYTGTFWAAFYMHCMLALSNEWFSIKYSKDNTALV